MRSSHVAGSRQWLLAKLKNGMHVEEYATLSINRSLTPVAIALAETTISGIWKPHEQTLQQFLSVGTELILTCDIMLKDVVDIKVRNDESVHREIINGKQCVECILIFHKNKNTTLISCIDPYDSISS